jgi:hypothetical protein
VKLPQANKNRFSFPPIARIIIQLALSVWVVPSYPIVAAVAIAGFHEVLFGYAPCSLEGCLIIFGAIIGGPAIFLSIFVRTPARWLRNLLIIGLIGGSCEMIMLLCTGGVFGHGITATICVAWINGGPLLVAIWNLWRLWKNPRTGTAPAKGIL